MLTELSAGTQICVKMLLHRGKHPTVWETEPLGSGDRSELTVLDQGIGVVAVKRRQVA